MPSGKKEVDSLSHCKYNVQLDQRWKCKQQKYNNLWKHKYNIFLTLYKEGFFNQGLNAYVGQDIYFQY